MLREYDAKPMGCPGRIGCRGLSFTIAFPLFIPTFALATQSYIIVYLSAVRILTKEI